MPFRVDVKMFEIGVGRWEARLVLGGQKRKVEEQGAGALPESCLSVTAFLVVLERRIADDGVWGLVVVNGVSMADFHDARLREYTRIT